MLHVVLGALFATYSMAAPPAGICPFDSSKVAANFGKVWVENLGVEAISDVFERREKWFGPCQSIKPTRGDFFTVTYSGVTYPLELKIRRGKIEEFAFGVPKFSNDSWEKYVSTLDKGFPLAGLFVVNLKTKKTIAALRDKNFYDITDSRDVLLAAAIQRKIKEGSMQNEQVLVLQKSDVASDFDDLSEKKPGFRLTVKEAKERMFSNVDHTAGDLLLRAIGREALEEGRTAAAPFLFRRERNWLMTLSPAKMKALTRSQDIEIARGLDKPKEIPPLAIARFDHLNKVGWWGSARELCGALNSIYASPELKSALGGKGFSEVHRGWKNAGYVSSSVTGSIQTTWIATPPGKDPICFSLTLNSENEISSEAATEILDRAYELAEKTEK